MAISIGEYYEFVSSSSTEEVGDDKLFAFSNRLVKVISEELDKGMEIERLWNVQTDDGNKFTVFESEISGELKEKLCYYDRNGRWMQAIV